jgi:membrane-associated phospholipid phosphatase
MDGLIQWGLGVVQWVQTFRSPILDQFIFSINFLGDEEFYLLFLPFVYWCVNKSLGYRFAFLFLLAEFANEFLKSIFAQPRPHQVSDKLYAPIKTAGYGIPSGHTQRNIVTWGYFATQLGRPLTRALAWLWWVIAFVIPILVGIARMYLGDHFPQDVIAGWLIGAAIVVIYVALQPRVAAWLARASFALKLAIAIIAPLALAAILLVQNISVTMGALLGFGVGAVLEDKYLRFSSRGEWWKQIVKLAIGLGIGLGLRIVLKPILGDALPMNFVRYAIIGWWFAFGAPWVFVKARLAANTPESNSGANEVKTR